MIPPINPRGHSPLDFNSDSEDELELEAFTHSVITEELAKVQQKGLFLTALAKEKILPLEMATEFLLEVEQEVRATDPFSDMKRVIHCLKKDKEQLIAIQENQTAALAKRHAYYDNKLLLLRDLREHTLPSLREIAGKEQHNALTASLYAVAEKAGTGMAVKGEGIQPEKSWRLRVEVSNAKEKIEQIEQETKKYVDTFEYGYSKGTT